MLTQLSIRNLAVASALDLEFSDGMTALSGETGAGKSIILDALSLILGERSSAEVVRHNCKRADINAVFDLSKLAAALDWLQARDLDQHNECIIRRTVSSEGRSRSYLNGQIVSLQDLREFSRLLMEVHGQHGHQSLLRPEHQLHLVDDFGDGKQQLDQVRKSFHQWQKAAGKLDALRHRSNDAEARVQLLSYQVNELASFAPVEGEFTQLENEHKQLANADSILTSLHEISEGVLNCDGGCLQQLNKCLSILNNQTISLPALESSRQLLQEALIQIEEADSELRSAQDSIEADPARLQEVELRLSDAHELARKHRVPTDDLVAKYNELSAELNNLTCADNNVDVLEEEVRTLHQQYLKEAGLLSKMRAAAAKELEQLIQQQLSKLGLKPVFVIAIQPLQKPRLNGMEELEMQISMNPGQPPKPLSKIASGGELSRISLAIQLVTALSSQTPTLVFDEVDVGIGGPTAEIVGRLLRELGGQTQVLCVTHLPQVASQAHHHFYVSKHVKEGSTQSRINRLSGEDRTHEIARMLGGIEITEHSIAHAKEMLASGNLH